MDFDLSHMSLILMIIDDRRLRYLNHECPNGSIIDVFNWNHYSSAWHV